MVGADVASLHITAGGGVDRGAIRPRRATREPPLPAPLLVVGRGARGRKRSPELAPAPREGGKKGVSREQATRRGTRAAQAERLRVRSAPPSAALRLASFLWAAQSGTWAIGDEARGWGWGGWYEKRMRKGGLEAVFLIPVYLHRYIWIYIEMYS